MKKFTILMSLILATIITGSVFAGDTRPAGLKAQLDTMRLEVPTRFECMLSDIKEDFSDDESTFLYVLKTNIKAYWDIREADYSDSIVAAALADFPCDFSTALYVMKTNSNASSELGDLLN